MQERKEGEGVKVRGGSSQSRKLQDKLPPSSLQLTHTHGRDFPPACTSRMLPRCVRAEGAGPLLGDVITPSSCCITRSISYRLKGIRCRLRCPTVEQPSRLQATVSYLQLHPNTPKTFDPATHCNTYITKTFSRHKTL